MNGAGSSDANPSGVQGVCPNGWHLPSDSEWKELELFLGMNPAEIDGTGERGDDEGGKLKEAGTSHWTSPNTGATNESGFTALPGGYRYNNGVFDGVPGNGGFRSTTEYSSSHSWLRTLRYPSAGVYRGNGYKDTGYSVRCIKDQVRTDAH